MKNTYWIMCPICKNKTRTKVRPDTELINFPLFCPKCKQESVINVNNYYRVRRFDAEPITPRMIKILGLSAYFI